MRQRRTNNRGEQYQGRCTGRWVILLRREVAGVEGMIGQNRKAGWAQSGAVWLAALSMVCGFIPAGALAQTDCGEGNGVLDTSAPKNVTVAELLQKFVAEETKVKEARTHYTYT